MPEWALFVVVTGGVVLVAVGALFLVSRKLPTWRDPDSSQVVIGVSALAMTFFALVIAFAVVSLDNSFEQAQANVQDESNALTQIVHDSRSFPGAERRTIETAVGAYVEEVRTHEFKALRSGKRDPRSTLRFDRLFAAVQTLKPATDNQRAFHSEMVKTINTVVSDRENRISAASSALPEAFWILIGLTAFVSILSTLFLKTAATGLDVVLVLIVAVVVGAGIMTTLLLQYPFSGSVAVSSDPFVQGVLGQLPGVTP
jgi:hypothetical protein